VRWLFQRIDGGTVDQVDVQPAVVIVVEQNAGLWFEKKRFGGCAIWCPEG
jgi:hypothetical protein